MKLLIEFEAPDKMITVRTGLSSVSELKALSALAETNNRSFEQIAQHAESLWEKELTKIQIHTHDTAFTIRFYTALYRSCL
ncbi:glycoside hydrolase domain-containing protein, partial [Parvimonas micra]|uniref:glycoside hydrolase domain-containing protein n=1 Tax=Parvimonas micra TaxID=33033 RepID=UPI002B47CF73